jgi:RHS repeat-associated protein
VIRRALFLLVLLALPAAAQQHPNTARGFNAAAGFGGGDVDSINPFNGNLVIGIPIGQAYKVNGNLSYRLTLTYNNNVWDYQQRETDTVTYNQAIANRTANAGLGWMVSLGRLNPPTATDVDSSRTVYMSPDGAFHTFYPTLHEGETSLAGVQYTRDGTYLRYKSATNEVELPDGTIHHFNANGFPDQIRDRFNNQITVDYNTANLWTISDGHRAQKVWFKTLLGTQVVDHIDLSAFGGATGTWTFHYSNDDGNNVQLTGCLNTDPTTTNTAVSLLTQVTLPDGSAYKMPVADYGTQTTTPCNSGMLKAMTLPTLGRIEWDYINYTFPTSSSPRAFRQTASGVGARRLKDASGLLIGQWAYSTAMTPETFPQKTRELVNTTVTPLNDKVVRYFSVSTELTSSGWSILDYGLPFTRYATDGGSQTRYLSSKIYDCDANGANCVSKRSNFLLYDRDDSTPSSLVEENARKNPRVLSTRTNYDDVGLLEAVSYSSFDGLGHYRQGDLFGNFGAGDSRTTYVNYNPGQTFPGAFTPPSPSAPWVLNTYTDGTVTEGGLSEKTEYCFDSTTGFLQRTRKLASGAARSGNDVVTRYTPSNDTFNHDVGNVAMEESFGGDGAGLDTTAPLCGLGLPANQYQTNYTYRYGSLATAQVPGMPFKTADRDIDAPTGLTSTSRDESLFATSYQYDTLGRTTYVKPAQDSWTWTVYTPASSSTSLAQIYMARQGNGGSGILAESKTLFDALGRPRQEQERMADGTWSSRTTAYNALGWKTSVSELGSANATSYLNYDPFGRPGTIRPPDGSAHDITLSYGGTHTVSRAVKVATSYNTGTGTASETVATTGETYDRQGRLVQVTEPNGVVTKYEYDVGARLKRVCQEASGSVCGQERLFTYDNRGYLTSEKHPEKGASGNGTVSYLSYDSHGHAGRLIDGPDDLTYSYDRADRLYQIRETGGAQRTLKAFTFGTSNSGTNSRLGKVQQAQRYNYVVLSGTPYTALITETYTYSGKQGRVSQRDTQLSVNGGTNESFTQSLAWDDLGNPQTINYPQCTFTGCTSAARSVTPTYTYGWLTALPSYTGTAPGQAAGVGITYYPNGLVKDIAHSNGVVDTQANDPNGMTRPASITASLSGTPLWATGTYQYDGAGNIWKIGTSWYEYDSLSRLKTGSVFPGTTGAGTQQKQTYSFDDYGNLQSTTTQIGAGTPTARNTPASASTNRLTGSVTYDAAGNLTSWNGAVYQYDAFDQMVHMTSGSEDWAYIYTADDERIWSYNVGLNSSIWALRGLNGKVLRTFTTSGGVMSVAEDYIYRNGLLLAGYLGSGQRRHFSLDHLGTVRLVTNSAGTQTDYHVYYPFGEEATAFDPNADRMQFTGHERDLNSQTGTSPSADDLDYMHARFFNPQVGRFTSVDLVDGNRHEPQSWNRYSYTLGNPLKLIDPTGMAAVNRCSTGYCFGDITVTAEDPLNGFYDFLWASYNFFGGAANAYSSNSLLGFGRYNSTEPGYQLGQAVGDLASIPAGLQEALVGGGLEGIGIGLDLTGAGAILGIPANIVGGVMIAHGGTTSALGAIHFMEGMKKGGYREKTRGANKEDGKRVDAVARKNGIGDRAAFGDYIEESKRLEGRGPSDNYSYKELERLAKEFKELFGGK